MPEYFSARLHPPPVPAQIQGQEAGVEGRLRPQKPDGAPPHRPPPFSYRAYYTSRRAAMQGIAPPVAAW